MAKKLDSKNPKINFTPPQDTTRMVITNAAPPEKSIYSNPVSMMNEVRTPSTSQVGYGPDGKVINPSKP